MRIGKKEALIYAYLEFLLIFGMLSRYIERSRIWNFLAGCFLIIIFISFRSVLKRILVKREIFFLVLIDVILFCLNVVSADGSKYLLRNLWESVFPVLMGVSLLLLVTRFHDITDNFLKFSFWQLNIWWIINLWVLSKQITGSGFMMKSWWIASNRYYADLCSGMFGYNGTHELAFFSCFMLIFNLFYSERLDLKKSRNLIRIYTIVTEAYMLFCSIFNDNKAMFFMIPYLCILYGLFALYWSKSRLSRKTLRVMKYIILACIGGVLLFSIPGVKEFFYSQVLDKLERLLHFRSTKVSGTNERLAIVQHALRNGWGWMFGKGMGYIRWISQDIMEFPHYGLSSIGAFVYQCGIWFYVVRCLLYTCIYVRLCYDDGSRKNGKAVFAVMALFSVLLFSLYSAVFTSAVSSYWILMMFIVFGGLRRYKTGSANSGR